MWHGEKLGVNIVTISDVAAMRKRLQPSISIIVMAAA